MRPDPEYLRRHYDSLTDAALLDIRREDLVDMARALYDAEVSRRGLDAKRAPARSRAAAVPAPEDEFIEPGDSDADLPEPGEPPDWLDEAAEVYSAAVRHHEMAPDQASNAMAVLEAASIPCHLDLVEMEEDRTPQPTHRWRVLVPSRYDLQAMSTLERDLSNTDFESMWKTHLENLSDDDLRASPPEVSLCSLFDRVERVVRVYEEELEKRGLK
jgi:hypothetical protein